MNTLNQTLQEKFPQLELSVLRLSEVKENKDFRIDDSFWTQQISYNNNLKYIKIKECLDVSQYGISISMNDIGKGVPIYRMNEIENMLCSSNVVKYAEVTENQFETFKLNYGDVLFNRTNSYDFVGRTGIFYGENNHFIFASYLVRFVPNKNIILPEYLTTYLNTQFGIAEIKRRARQSINQTNVNPEEVKEIKIPLLDMDFQRKIQKCFKDSHKALESSKALYREAEDLLYESLGLNPQNPLDSVLTCFQTLTRPFRGAEHWEKGGSSASANAKLEMDIARHSPISEKAAAFLRAGERGEGAALFAIEENKKSIQSNKNITSCNPPNCTIKTLKESFLKTGRLDSEYYQVKYEEIESFIQSYQGGFSKLEIVEIKDSNFTPKDKEKYRYIELANIGSNGNISAPLEELREDLPTRARRLVKEGDLIISSVEGSLGSCALITKEFHHCIVSTGFYVLKSQSINSETLLVLFKSSFFQDYLKKFPSGTILTAISKEELQNILIPKINPNTQDSIASHIQQSFILRNEAKALLEEAKAKVESAISGGGG